jgi:hypothetical protein
MGRENVKHAKQTGFVQNSRQTSEVFEPSEVSCPFLTVAGARLTLWYSPA